METNSAGKLWVQGQRNKITSKVASITFNILYHSQSSKLHLFLHSHDPICSLRSCSANLLSVLFVCTAFVAHSFTITFTSSKIWNSLPNTLLTSNSWFLLLSIPSTSKLLCAELYDTMFTVSSTLIWAVLTGPTY